MAKLTAKAIYNHLFYYDFRNQGFHSTPNTVISYAEISQHGPQHLNIIPVTYPFQNLCTLVVGHPGFSWKGATTGPRN